MNYAPALAETAPAIIPETFRPSLSLLANEVTVSSLPEVEANHSFEVRSATSNDVSALVAVEKAAFKDVYGKDIDGTDQELSEKFAERVELLGKWIKVIEDQDKNVFGMIIGFPTDASVEELVENDMTDNRVIGNLFNQDGRSIYVVNLAVDNRVQQGRRFELFKSFIAEGVGHGAERAYFTSRLPGFKKWCEVKNLTTDTMAEEDLNRLADEYSRSTRVYKGKDIPLDKLLRMYYSIGACPVTLVSDAWGKDTPSLGYGMLCEIENPVKKDSRKTIDKAACSLIKATAELV